MNSTVRMALTGPKFNAHTAQKRSLRLSDFKRHGKKAHVGRNVMDDVVLPAYLQEQEEEPGNGNGEGDLVE